MTDSPEDQRLREALHREGPPELDRSFSFDQARWAHDWNRRFARAQHFHRAWWGLAASALVIVGSLTALHAHGIFRDASTVPTSHNSQGPQPYSARQNPVITQAMQALGPHPGVPLEAPRTLPFTNRGPTTLSATAYTWGGKILPAYQVELWQTAQSWPINSPHISQGSRRLASFSGTDYTALGRTAEQQGLRIASGFSQPQKSGLSLSIAGMPTVMYRTTSPIAAVSATSILWTEKPWKFRINAPTTVLAEQKAKELVHMLRTVHLPSAANTGFVVVDVEQSVTAQGAPRFATTTTITWAQSSTVYQIVTFTRPLQRLSTALALTASMQAYPWSSANG